VREKWEVWVSYKRFLNSRYLLRIRCLPVSTPFASTVNFFSLPGGKIAGSEVNDRFVAFNRAQFTGNFVPDTDVIGHFGTRVNHS
jgi:hypothetical protein